MTRKQSTCLESAGLGEGDERNFKTPDELIKAVLKKILKK